MKINLQRREQRDRAYRNKGDLITGQARRAAVIVTAFPSCLTCSLRLALGMMEEGRAHKEMCLQFHKFDVTWEYLKVC